MTSRAYNRTDISLDTAVVVIGQRRDDLEKNPADAAQTARQTADQLRSVADRLDEIADEAAEGES